MGLFGFGEIVAALTSTSVSNWLRLRAGIWAVNRRLSQ